jgi:nucleoside-diphosphate-sugar epimerase
MKILVTGANGFIGTSLVEQLSLLHHEVEVFTRRDKVKTYTGTKFDVVINCAASIHNENLNQMYEDNVLLTYDLLTKLKYDHFIQIGSSSEYGSTEEMMSIKDCPAPATSYEGTKSAATMLALGVGKSLGKKVSVVRPFSIYGPGMTKRSFLQTLTKALLYDEPYTLYAGAHDWVYIDDFVEGLVRILELKLEGIFNLCSGRSSSNKEIAEIIANVLDKPTDDLQVINKKYRTYDKETWYGNRKETLQLLGWETKTTLLAGLTKCIKNWT